MKTSDDMARKVAKMAIESDSLSTTFDVMMNAKMTIIDAETRNGAYLPSSLLARYVANERSMKANVKNA
jgi:hypothetical protein